MSDHRSVFPYGNIPPARERTIGEIAGLFAPSPSATTNLFGLGRPALDRYRRRAEWNSRFEHWEKPASSTEESTLQRAQRMVRAAIKDAVWLNTQGATVEPQGSYYNNTNTRLDSDADLRVQLPLVKVDYHPNVVVDCAGSVLGLKDTGWTYDQLFKMMRWELEHYLGEAFGRRNVVAGKKAFRVSGLTGSRAEVDVVPALRYQHVMWWDHASRYNTIEGAAILSTEGAWTLNFPDHHHVNGIAKRTSTRHQFKKVVRIFKRLRADLAARGLLHKKVSSFLIESLIYNVEDGFFTVIDDDRFGRARRVAQRLQWMVRDEPTAERMVEINGIKQLFTVDQGWAWHDAITFADAVVAHLGDM